jgi:hypothetical protein
MFDKIFKVVLICLLASLVGIVGWFCRARRDVGKFAFQDTSWTQIAVLDTTTGVTRVLFAPELGDNEWIEANPTTAHVVMRPVVFVDSNPPIKPSPPSPAPTPFNEELARRLKEAMKSKK